MRTDELTTDWSAGIPAAEWPSSAGATATAGQVSLTSGTWGGYESHAQSVPTALTDSHLVARLLDPPDYLVTGAAAEAYVQLIDTTRVVPPSYTSAPALGADGLLWLWTSSATGGALRAAYRKNGAERRLAEVPYSQLTTWLRIRESGGIVYWDTSRDGRTWTTRAAWPHTLADLTTLRADLRAGWWSIPEAGIPGPTVFGPVNVVPAPLQDPATVLEGNGVPYVAVDVIPELGTGTFMLSTTAGDPDGSFIDGDDLLGWAQLEEGAWVNVVCDVTAVEIRRGSTQLQGVRTRAEAGWCSITLTDTWRRFDPLVNADAIHANTPVRVRAWGYDLAGERWDAVLFTGTIRDPLVRYRQDDAPEVTITASDLIADLATWRAAGRTEPGAGSGDDLLTRVGRTLTEMGVQQADVLSWDVDTVGYAALLAPAVLAQPWAELTAAQDAELGALWVDRDNRLAVRTRRSELTGPVRGTFSDVHGDADPGTVHCCYGELDATLGTEQTVNRAIGQRRIPGNTSPPPGEPAVITTQDAASGARWGWRVADERSLELLTDRLVTIWTQDLVASSSTPQLRVDAVAPAPSPVDLDSALQAWPAVCATDLGDRWAVRYRPAVGPAVDRTAGVLGIEHVITPEEWTVLFRTVDAPPVTLGNPSGFFLLDDSEVDSGDVLWPWSGQEAFQRF